MQNALDSFIREVSKRSDITERVFLDLFLACGFEGRLSTKNEQIRDHIDVWITDVHGKIWPKGTTKSIDVKDQKWTGYDVWRFDEDLKKPVKTGERRVPPFGKDEPCCSYEYSKFGYKGNTVCEKQPHYFAFESVEEGTEPHELKDKKFEIGKSFYLIESCVVKKDALNLYDEKDMRKPEAVKKKYMRCYYQLLVQRNDRGDNHYAHIPMKHIRELPHMYLRTC